MRTFSQQVKHVATVNYILGGGILGEKPPVDTGGEDGSDSAKSKADIMKYLKDSFDYLGVPGKRWALLRSLWTDGRVPANERNHPTRQPAVEFR